MSQLTAGIDLGGTNIQAVVAGPDGVVLGRDKRKTDSGSSLDDTAAGMHETTLGALQSAGATLEDLVGVGIAIPSAVDPETGRLLHAPNLGWKDEPAQPVFERVFGREVVLENDVNCGTLAEYRLGAGRGAHTLVGFFVGTGLGGGLVIDGKLHRGVRGAAGEVGHQVIRFKGRTCGCGNRGCAEAYASKTGFGQHFDRLINRKGLRSCLQEELDGDYSNVRSKVLARAFGAKDKVVRKVLTKGCRRLGLATANVIAVLAPDCVVYGGGVMEALGEELLPHIRQGIRENLFALSIDDISVKLSELGDDAVTLGAAMLAHDASRQGGSR